MLDLLSELRLQSALPFGLAISLATLIAVTVGGALGALRLGGRAPRWLAGLVAMAAALRLVLGLTSGLLLDEDLNPRVEADQLTGAWVDGAQRLDLRADRTYLLRGPVNDHGSWSVEDWNLRLGARRARVITVNGVPRIVADFPSDPDTWDGHLGYARQGRKRGTQTVPGTFAVTARNHGIDAALTRSSRMARAS